MWQLVTLHNKGVHVRFKGVLPWGNEEWRLFGPKHKTKREVLASLKTARRIFDDLEFSYRKVPNAIPTR